MNNCRLITSLFSISLICINVCVYLNKKRLDEIEKKVNKLSKIEKYLSSSD